MAAVVHDAEIPLRIGVALRCSEPKPMSLRLVVLARGGHGVPDERGQLASGAGLGTGLRHRARDARRQNQVQVLGVTSGLFCLAAVFRCYLTIYCPTYRTTAYMNSGRARRTPNS